jgi:hypothetical protein
LLLRRPCSMENNVQVTDAYGIFLADISNIMLSLIVFFAYLFLRMSSALWSLQWMN